MTNQEVFDKVLSFLRNQKYISTLSGQCRYRGRDGRMCAVGCLIPDNLYDPEMESMPASTVLAMSPELQNLFDGVDERMLMDLQSAHDGNMPSSTMAESSNIYKLTMASWESAMKRIARDYRLEYNEPR